MQAFEVALIEWPHGRDAGGPLVLGHTTDPEIIAQVREVVAAARRRELAHIEPPVRSVPVEKPEIEPEPHRA